jgi:ubiquinone/menaquinone biosynthesis C-methylase UbiE
MTRVSRRRVLALIGTAALAPLAARAQVDAGPYVPSPSMIVDRMLELGGVRGDDYLFDLGSGDGRIVITAARRFGTRGYGVEIKPELVKLATEQAARAGVADKVRFERRDLFQTDLSEATVVTLYLLPGIVKDLVPKILAEMKPGARVVSHDYPLSPWTPDRFVQFDTEEKVPISGTTRTVLYLYTVPARVAGEWRAQVPGVKGPVVLAIAQHPVKTTASATLAGRKVSLDDFTVRGETVRFSLPGVGPGGRPLVLEGRAAGDTIEGTVASAGAPAAWRAVRAATK